MSVSVRVGCHRTQVKMSVQCPDVSGLSKPYVIAPFANEISLLKGVRGPDKSPLPGCLGGVVRGHPGVAVRSPCFLGDCPGFRRDVAVSGRDFAGLDDGVLEHAQGERGMASNPRFGFRWGGIGWPDDT